MINRINQMFCAFYFWALMVNTSAALSLGCLVFMILWAFNPLDYHLALAFSDLPVEFKPFFYILSGTLFFSFITGVQSLWLNMFQILNLKENQPGKSDEKNDSDSGDYGGNNSGDCFNGA